MAKTSYLKFVLIINFIINSNKLFLNKSYLLIFSYNPKNFQNVWEILKYEKLL